MGIETNCTLERDGRKVVGKAMLETEHLLFRGGTKRLKLLRSDIVRVAVRDDALVVETLETLVLLHLPAGMSPKWLAKIRNPRSLLDKLGVKDGMKVVVIGDCDADFIARLEERVGSFGSRASSGTDVIIFAAESLAALERLATLRQALVPNGAIWVVHRKGPGAALRDVDVFSAGRRAGLVDNKVASFSATHTAERLVIPLIAR